MGLSKYLGAPVSELLEAVPFRDWRVEESTEDQLDEPIVHFVFEENGLELRCDEARNISVIFLDSSFDRSLSEVPFARSRAHVREHFAVAPSKGGEATNDPVLGAYGAWDRFLLPGYAVHVEYRTDADQVGATTLMRSHTIP